MNCYNLLLWGMGRRAQMYLNHGYLSMHNIIGIIDTYKKEESFFNIPIYPPENLSGLLKSVDYLVITNRFYDEILRKCWDMHINFEKIVILDNVQGTFFSECFARLRNISEELYQRRSVEEYCIIHTNLSDRDDESRLLGKGKYASHTSATDYMSDYFRYRTFELAAKEIKKRKISGALAELGVFRGMFASLINETFPERTLYLLDTFESFDLKEFRQEAKLDRVEEGMDFFEAHSETSKEILMLNIPNPESCIVCKGLFPASITPRLEDEHFAFVSIDVDLEESTYQGMNFFYPRLSEGGYIFLHDYTTHHLQGVQVAVKRYEKDNGIVLKKIPIADRGGTLIITK